MISNFGIIYGKFSSPSSYMLANLTELFSYNINDKYTYSIRKYTNLDCKIDNFYNYLVGNIRLHVIVQTDFVRKSLLSIYNEVDNKIIKTFYLNANLCHICFVDKKFFTVLDTSLYENYTNSDILIILLCLNENSHIDLKIIDFNLTIKRSQECINDIDPIIGDELPEFNLPTASNGDTHICPNKAYPSLRVSSVKFCPQIKSLICGYSCGHFEIWNLYSLQLEFQNFSSPLPIDQSIRDITFQEPENDPRPFYYIWFAHGNNINSLGYTYADGVLPIISLYQLMYKAKNIVNMPVKSKGLNCKSSNDLYIYTDLVHCQLYLKINLMDIISVTNSIFPPSYVDVIMEYQCVIINLFSFQEKKDINEAAGSYPGPTNLESSFDEKENLLFFTAEINHTLAIPFQDLKNNDDGDTCSEYVDIGGKRKHDPIYPCTPLHSGISSWKQSERHSYIVTGVFDINQWYNCRMPLIDLSNFEHTEGSKNDLDQVLKCEPGDDPSRRHRICSCIELTPFFSIYIGQLPNLGGEEILPVDKGIPTSSTKRFKAHPSPTRDCGNPHQPSILDSCVELDSITYFPGHRDDPRLSLTGPSSVTFRSKVLTRDGTVMTFENLGLQERFWYFLNHVTLPGIVPLKNPEVYYRLMLDAKLYPATARDLKSEADSVNGVLGSNYLEALLDASLYYTRYGWILNGLSEMGGIDTDQYTDPLPILNTLDTWISGKCVALVSLLGVHCPTPSGTSTKRPHHTSVMGDFLSARRAHGRYPPDSLLEFVPKLEVLNKILGSARATLVLTHSNRSSVRSHEVEKLVREWYKKSSLIDNILRWAKCLEWSLRQRLFLDYHYSDRNAGDCSYAGPANNEGTRSIPSDFSSDLENGSFKKSHGATQSDQDLHMSGDKSCPLDLILQKIQQHTLMDLLWKRIRSGGGGRGNGVESNPESDDSDTLSYHHQSRRDYQLDNSTTLFSTILDPTFPPNSDRYRFLTFTYSTCDYFLARATDRPPTCTDIPGGDEHTATPRTLMSYLTDPRLQEYFLACNADKSAHRGRRPTKFGSLSTFYKRLTSYALPRLGLFLWYLDRGTTISPISPIIEIFSHDYCHDGAGELLVSDNPELERFIRSQKNRLIAVYLESIVGSEIHETVFRRLMAHERWIPAYDLFNTWPLPLTTVKRALLYLTILLWNGRLREALSQAVRWIGPTQCLSPNDSESSMAKGRQRLLKHVFEGCYYLKLLPDLEEQLYGQDRTPQPPNLSQREKGLISTVLKTYLRLTFQNGTPASRGYAAWKSFASLVARTLGARGLLLLGTHADHEDPKYWSDFSSGTRGSSNPKVSDLPRENGNSNMVDDDLSLRRLGSIYIPPIDTPRELTSIIPPPPILHQRTHESELLKEWMEVLDHHQSSSVMPSIGRYSSFSELFNHTFHVNQEIGEHDLSLSPMSDDKIDGTIVPTTLNPITPPRSILKIKTSPPFKKDAILGNVGDFGITKNAVGSRKSQRVVFCSKIDDRDIPLTSLNQPESLTNSPNPLKDHSDMSFNDTDKNSPNFSDSTQDPDPEGIIMDHISTPRSILAQTPGSHPFDTTEPTPPTSHVNCSGRRIVQDSLEPSDPAAGHGMSDLEAHTGGDSVFVMESVTDAPDVGCKSFGTVVTRVDFSDTVPPHLSGDGKLTITTRNEHTMTTNMEPPVGIKYQDDEESPTSYCKLGTRRKSLRQRKRLMGDQPL